MKREKMRRMLCIGLSLIMTLGMVGCKEEEAPQSYEYIQSEAVAVTETENLQITIEKGILEEENQRNWAVYRLDQAYVQALDFLGEDYTRQEKLQCDICAGDGLTQISENALDIYFYETVDQPYTNYMIQILSGFQTADWLREGLAAYGADLTEESLMESYAAGVLTELDALRTETKEEAAEYADISKLAQVLYSEGSYEEAMALGDMLKTMSGMESAEEASKYRAAYCIYAGSFIQYLVETKGLDEVLRVYNGEEFKNVMGQTIDSMKKEWISETLEAK